eukprot:2913290-Prymnesium_polylepis.1
MTCARGGCKRDARREPARPKNTRPSVPPPLATHTRGAPAESRHLSRSQPYLSSTSRSAPTAARALPASAGSVLSSSAPSCRLARASRRT